MVIKLPKRKKNPNKTGLIFRDTIEKSEWIKENKI
jgi:hypothetical protein